jgi:transposase
MSRKKEIDSALWKQLEPLLPVMKPSPQGGRPRLDDELDLNDILFVLHTGSTWEDQPRTVTLLQQRWSTV